MVSSGFNVEDEVVAQFKQLGKKKIGYMIIKCEEERAFVETVGERNTDGVATFADFKSKMPVDEPRWAVFDLEWKTEDSRIMNKIVFIQYCPDACTVSKSKVLLAQHKDKVKEKCSPVNREK